MSFLVVLRTVDPLLLSPSFYPIHTHPLTPSAAPTRYRLGAIRLYLSMGFVPWPRDDDEKKAWADVQAQMGQQEGGAGGGEGGEGGAGGMDGKT